MKGVIKMKVEASVIKKHFTTENGEVREYYAISIPLINGETVEITLKSDKAKLILLSQALSK